jgi:hypothetical protein
MLIWYFVLSLISVLIVRIALRRALEKPTGWLLTAFLVSILLEGIHLLFSSGIAGPENLYFGMFGISGTVGVLYSITHALWLAKNWKNKEG